MDKLLSKTACNYPHFLGVTMCVKIFNQNGNGLDYEPRLACRPKLIDDQIRVADSSI